MQEKIICVDLEEKLAAAKRIISALRYLHHNCPMDEFRPILKVSLDLCVFAAVSRPQNLDALSPGTDSLSAREFVEGLEYLKNEASKSRLEDIEVILFASFSLCTLLYCYNYGQKHVSMASLLN